MGTRILIACFGLGFAAAAAPPVGAQLRPADPGLRGRTHIGFGYVVNLPMQMFGLDGLLISPALRNWGVYADYKRYRDSPRDGPLYRPDRTVEDAESLGDFPLDSESDWRTVNVAVVRVVSPALALYLGAGMSKERAYRRYVDDNDPAERDPYWVDLPADSGDRVNVLGGAWFRALPSVLFQFGVEAAPTGATVGASYILPLGR